jgi:hypothetical protein
MTVYTKILYGTSGPLTPSSGTLSFWDLSWRPTGSLSHQLAEISADQLARSFHCILGASTPEPLTKWSWSRLLRISWAPRAAHTQHISVTTAPGSPLTLEESRNKNFNKKALDWWKSSQLVKYISQLANVKIRTSAQQPTNWLGAIPEAWLCIS